MIDKKVIKRHVTALWPRHPNRRGVVVERRQHRRKGTTTITIRQADDGGATPAMRRTKQPEREHPRLILSMASGVFAAMAGSPIWPRWLRARRDVADVRPRRTAPIYESVASARQQTGAR